MFSQFTRYFDTFTHIHHHILHTLMRYAPFLTFFSSLVWKLFFYWIFMHTWVRYVIAFAHKYSHTSTVVLTIYIYFFFVLFSLYWNQPRTTNAKIQCCFGLWTNIYRQTVWILVSEHLLSILFCNEWGRAREFNNSNNRVQLLSAVGVSFFGCNAGIHFVFFF